MSDFRGITSESLFLLAENRFHDSKAFYEEHKPIIKRDVLQPLSHLIEELTPFMLTVDPHIAGHVSRIRRDNRFTHDKSMYRENIWITFMRDKRAWDWCVPAFYLDASLRGAEWGVGFYSATPTIMKVLRRRTQEQPKQMLQALRKAKRAGFVLSGQPYARPRSTPDTPAALRPIYDCRTIRLSRYDAASLLAEPELPQRLKKAFAALAPFYSLVMQAVEESARAGCGKAEKQ